nr:aryl-phospho-beta-D-glucosidase [Candidatus Pantoea persica]
MRLASTFSLRRCQILAITHSEQSALAKINDFTLAYHVPLIRLNDNYDITHLVPVMYILGAIGRLLIK